jgi:enoyl-CoA hydratase
MATVGLDTMSVRTEYPSPHVLLVTLDRPDCRNAWNQDVIDRLHAVWRHFADDESLRVCVVTGSPPIFTAGLDLKQVPADGSPGMPNLSVPCDKPILVAVEGAAIGFGSVFCQLADMVFAGQSAYFEYPEARLGLFQGMMGGFPGRLQYKAALQWLLCAERLSAHRACEIGLVNEVCADGAALDRALAVAEKIAANAPLVVQAIKSIALASVPKGPMEIHHPWHLKIAKIMSSEDGQEGLKALRERRSPAFRGR